MSSSAVSALAVVALSLLPLAGCSGGVHSNNRISSAPALTDTGVHPKKAPANPNAPYAVLQRRVAPAPSVVQAATIPSAEDVAQCSASNLSISEIASNTKASERSVSIAFTNTGSMPCQISGYPNVSFSPEDQAAWKSLAVLHDENAKTPDGPVILQPHAAASFSLRWTTGADCPSISKLLVTAPGTNRSFGLNRPVSPCEGRIEITALQANPTNG